VRTQIAATEYRVRWKREGRRAKRKIFQTRRGADRFVLLFGQAPWKAYDKDPDESWCCRGDECMCGGKTVRQESEERRREMPRLEFAVLEQRGVQEWQAP
jgi:hypothetical protein